MSEPADTAPTDFTRREALALLAALPLAAAVDPSALAARAWRHIAAAASAHGAPYTPQFFSAAEWRTVRCLTDEILPRDERSGSASEAGVPEFVDFIMVDQPRTQHAMREGLRWIDAQCAARFAVPLADCTVPQRASVLDDIAWPARARPEMAQGVAFFTVFRNLTAAGFWTSQMGIADLRYMGNTVVPEWRGCPPEALAKLGVTY